ncbi:Acyl-CoA--sterol O-acyltransferase 1 [Forsythia ovata]|uniref:Acyl-CoA--sterol O-acyltransferase 1 n=1 Tax=Forsythia ovata TaxID=205694 RepID=A0ABD1R670_9LAMI
MDVMLGVVAIIGQFLLGTEVAPPFNNPYFASSLRDFWGRRWNCVSSSTLRLAVYNPVLNKASRIIGPKLAPTLALLSTFVVSALIHEIIFYYLGRVMPRWGTTLFFLIQGLCLVVENTLKTKINVKWHVPRLIMGPLVFGFIVYTFMRLVMPELLEYNVVERAIAEYAAVVDFVKDASLYWVKCGKNCWYKTWNETAYVCQQIN